jgi:hypothetical protein
MFELCQKLNAYSKEHLKKTPTKNKYKICCYLTLVLLTPDYQTWL